MAILYRKEKHDIVTQGLSINHHISHGINTQFGVIRLGEPGNLTGLLSSYFLLLLAAVGKSSPLSTGPTGSKSYVM